MTETPAATSGSAWSRALGAVIAASALLRVYVAPRPLAQLDGLIIPDDAYLSLTITRNIAPGRGSLYGTHFTNGFQPLYVFLAAPFFLNFPHQPEVPVHAALLLSVAFDTATLYPLTKHVATFCRSRAAPLLVALAWALDHYVISTTLNGLETSISCFFVVVCLVHYHRHFVAQQKPVPARIAIALGLFLGLAILARIDNTLLAAYSPY